MYDASVHYERAKIVIIDVVINCVELSNRHESNDVMVNNDSNRNEGEIIYSV